MSEIIKGGGVFDGCDLVLQLGEHRRGSKIKLLQATDMQILDATQRRTPDRLNAAEIATWSPKNFDKLFGNQMRTLVSQVQPDLIFMTGDLVYGEFDDNGSAFRWFCDFMDSLCVPWVPVFGNHDNESAMGADWQCEQFKKSRFCMFEQGAVSGNGNFTVGIATGDTLVRVLHMIDTHGCRGMQPAEICTDQIELFIRSTEKITAAQGREVPAFMAFHIPTAEFLEAEQSKGYAKVGTDFYTIAVDVQAKDGDFGCKMENLTSIAKTDFSFLEAAKKCNVDTVFVGHYHRINTVITYKGLRLVFGLKTGQYDFINAGQLGGTRVVLEDDSVDICHIPSLALYAPLIEGLTNFDKNIATE